MEILLLIILVIVIGSKVVYKDNYAVITGSMSISANGSLTKDINYPSGFNVDNCVPISCGLKVLENKGYNFIGDYLNSSSLLINAYDRSLNLISTAIQLYVINPTDSSKTVTYKIVLMKI